MSILVDARDFVKHFKLFHLTSLHFFTVQRGFHQIDFCVIESILKVVKVALVLIESIIIGLFS